MDEPTRQPADPTPPAGVDPPEDASATPQAPDSEAGAEETLPTDPAADDLTTAEADAGAADDADAAGAAGAAEEASDAAEGTTGAAADTAGVAAPAGGTGAEEAETLPAAAGFATTPVAADASAAAEAAEAAVPVETTAPAAGGVDAAAVDALIAGAAGAGMATQPVPPPPPPVAPPPPVSGGAGAEPPEGGTSVLLVGALLIGAIIVALGIVLLLFQPFGGGGSATPIVTPSPSPSSTGEVSPEPTGVAAPDFRGVGLADAQSIANDTGVVLRVTTRETDEFPPGTVLEQDPRPGTFMAPGSTVELVVAAKVTTVAVPDLAGEREQDALDALEAAGLVAGERSDAFDESAPAGTVTAQEPAPATEVAPGSAVDYTVSKGPEPVALPDLTGQSAQDAAAALEAAGFVVGPTEERFDPTLPAGTLIATDPAAGSELVPGSEVTLIVSKGPEPVAVPDLAGEREQDALDALEAAGLVAGERSDAFDESAPAGTVTAQEPAPATEVAPGSAVDYTVSKGPEPVALPDLTGQSAQDAAAALEAAGFVVGPTEERFDPTLPAGTLIATDPAAGSELVPGSEVTLIVSKGPEPVAVPDLAGEREQDALDALEAAGLVAGERSDAFDESAPAGTVTAQEPAPATEVAPGSAVDYTVSKGPEPVALPDLTGQSAQDAAAALEAAGFVVGPTEERFDPTLPAGTLIATDPAAGSELVPGSEVTLIVSKGPEPVAVPDLAGEREQDALDALEAAGLVAGERSDAFDESAPAGTVTAQEPAPATEVAPGSAVDYTVSKGPEPVALPDLTGQSAQDAAAALEAAGFVVGPTEERFDPTLPAGTLIATDPAAGSELVPGSEVTLIVSKGPEPVAVPDLAGEREQDALDALEAAGLVAGERSDAFDESAPAGTVTAQEPAPATEVARGSAVDYTVSKGPEPVALPDLTGQSAQDAAAALEAAGFVVGPTEERFDPTLPAGTLIATDPAAGSELVPGSEVTLIVSKGPEPVALPDLTGQSAQDAAATLEAAGFVVGPTEERFDPTLPAGTLIATDPAAGSELVPGSEVTLIVSKGPEPVALPDLTGQSAQDAAATLEAAGFVVGPTEERFDPTLPAGTLIATDPAAGSELVPGSEVTLIVSKGPEPVALPDLAGKSAEDADAALADAGLATGTVDEAFDESAPAGTVTAQAPAPGTEAARGSAVDYTLSKGPQPVAVPDVSGRSVDEASAALAEAGLAAGATSEAFSDTVAAGAVISSDPAAGSEVAPGSEVTLIVSKGPEPVAVPDLAGKSAEDADAALADAGLATGTVDEAFDPQAPAGTVTAQAPAPGTEAARGSAVDYTLSKGPQPVAVPDVSGRSVDEASAALAEAGLAAGATSEAFSDTVAAGAVISSDPAAGSEVAPGSEVTLIVSKGPEPVAVPDLAGKSAEDADAALADAGLATGTVDEAFDPQAPAGTVTAQAPAPGTEAARGSAVDYTLSKGPQPVAVPDVSGRSVDEASAALAEAGLAAGATSEAFSDTVAAGAVISSDPAAGSEVAPGSEVTLIVSKGPEPVAVPDLAGKSAEDADAALADAGLATGTVDEAFDPQAPAGTVTAQAPAPGTEAARGSAVDYTLSKGPQPVAVPDVSGRSVDEASAALAEAGLAAGATSEAFSDTVAAGAVISSDPAAGSEVAPGSEVTLIVSKGPEPVAVPDLAGKSAEDADAALADAGLATGTVDEAFDPQAPAGTVTAQAPAPGTEAARGSAVDYTLSKGPQPVAVPDVSGRSVDEASAALAEAGLAAGATSEAFSDTVAAGAVISSDPAAGSEVAPGSEVTLIVSKGPEPVAVPDLAGKSAEDADAALADAGLATGTVDEAFDPQAPAGTVTAQAPAPGTEAARGSAVDYTLSKGPQPVAVPDVSGRSVDEASAALAEAGLAAGATSEAFSDTVAAGAVISSDPAAGSEVAPGSEVTLIVSKGPEPVAVPDLAGKSAEDADAALADAGLATGTVDEAFDESAPAGTVTAQAPAPGTEAARGSAVDYTLSKGPQPVAVPDVSGRSVDEASAALAEAGLAAGATSEAFSDTVAAGAVISSDPAAGSEVAPGSEVTLIVSKGPEPVAVPDLAGKSAEDADAALADAGLATGTVDEAFDPQAPAGTVTAQAPAPGTEAARGSAVDYTLSKGPQPVAVPDVSGRSVDEASAALAEAGLAAGATSEAFSDTVAAGAVISSDPAAGSEVAPGSEVTLIVSKGPEPVAVPDLAGKSAEDADAALADAGLATGTVDEAFDPQAPAGTVTAQAPAPGTEAARGSAVDYTLSKGPQPVAVPDLVGQDEQDALAALDGVGLVAGERSKDFSDTVAQGSVIATDPAAGTEVEPRSPVAYTVSKGPAPVPVPDVTGQSEQDANAVIEGAGLAAGTIDEEFSDSVAQGSVIRTDPAAGTEVAAGSPVVIVVSRGPEPTPAPTPEPTVAAVVVPDVAGQTEGDALATLDEAGLAAGKRSKAFSDTVPQGAVVSTDPAAGTEVDPGSAVAYTVSKGPEATPAPTPEPTEAAVAVPDVVGQTEGDATSGIEGADLAVGGTEERFSDTVPQGTVIKTDPPAGTDLAPGSEVTLIVSKGPQLIAVPDIGTLPEDQARAALTEAKLTAGTRSEEVSDAPAGTVIAQDPAAGTEVPKGSPVSYTVATRQGPPADQSIDPQVVGQLDQLASDVPGIRGLPFEAVPYASIGGGQLSDTLAARWTALHDPATLPAEEEALKRLGLLPADADLESLLDSAYGQTQPVSYLPDDRSLAVLKDTGKLSAQARGQAAREVDRGVVDQAFGLDSIRVGDHSKGDRILARSALELGDATALMLEWSAGALGGDANQKVIDVAVPGKKNVIDGLPPIVRAEYQFPYLDGRAFAEAIKARGGWSSVDDAWATPPQSTEQIMHPERYPNDKSVSVELPDVASALPGGWSEAWSQTMGEMRIGVWLAAGAKGSQASPADPVVLPSASAAAGWGGDRLVSLEGPDGAWAIAWQTAWDGGDDADEFAAAAEPVLADLGAHAILGGTDVVGGLPSPVLVLLASDDQALQSVADALGVQGLGGGEAGTSGEAGGAGASGGADAGDGGGGSDDANGR